MASSDVAASGREMVTMLLGAKSPEVKAVWCNVDSTIVVSMDEGVTSFPFVINAGSPLPLAGKDIWIVSMTGGAITDLVGLNWGS